MKVCPLCGKLSITSRQVDLLRSYSIGVSPKEIAKAWGMSLQTVKNTSVTAFSNLGARNKAHAVAIAIQERII